MKAAETLVEDTRLPERFSPDDIIIDIGAHIGAFAYACLQRGAGRVIAFEPEPENYALPRLSLLTPENGDFCGRARRKSRRRSGCISKIACGADPASSPPRFSAYPLEPSCISNVIAGSRTARSTGTGPSWRAAAVRAGAWCSGMCSIWGEINDSQQASWLRCIEAFDPRARAQVRLALFPEDRPVPAHARQCGVQVRLREFSIRRSRQWGVCWLFLQLWEELHLPQFWRPRLPASREGTSWYHVLVVLCAYRLIAPGSEWRLHREWFERSAMADLLGEDFALAAKDTLDRALDRLGEHKEELFNFLQERWTDLFGLTFDVLLYDLTSTYFESDPPFGEGDPRRHGYSRDHRPDCVQVVIALVVTPEGFPLAYEVLAGNTADNTTLRAFLKKIETRYGKARRIWVMDRGIPTEEVLAEMRQSDPPVSYVVGTPKGRLSQLEAALTERPWHVARERVQVKLLPQAGELYVLVHSGARVDKERAMRRRQLEKLWRRLRQLQSQRPGYERLLLELGAAKKKRAASGRWCAWTGPSRRRPARDRAA
jgi:hypothetical protein